jgi:hypothetical protein
MHCRPNPRQSSNRCPHRNLPRSKRSRPTSLLQKGSSLERSRSLLCQSKQADEARSLINFSKSCFTKGRRDADVARDRWAHADRSEARLVELLKMTRSTEPLLGRPLIILSMALVAIVAGCSSADNPGTSSSAGPDPASLLVSVRDLPEKTEVEDAPPELCGPLPIFKREGGQSAASKMFRLGQVRFAEAIGVFKTSAKALSAYEGLNDRKRIECIQNAVSTNLQGPSVKILRSEPLNIDTRGYLVRYQVTDTDSPRRAYVDVVSIIFGRCTAALLVLTEGRKPSGGRSAQISEVAVDRMGNTCMPQD